jgi:hypothetical protein
MERIIMHNPLDDFAPISGFQPEALIWVPFIVLVICLFAYAILWLTGWTIPENDLDDTDITDLEIMSLIKKNGCAAVQCDRFCRFSGCRAKHLYSDKYSRLKRKGLI